MKPSNKASGADFGGAFSEAIASLMAIQDIGQSIGGGGDGAFQTITVGTCVSTLARAALTAIKPLEGHPLAREHVRQAQAVFRGLDTVGDGLIDKHLNREDSDEALKMVGGVLEGLICAAAFHLNNAACESGSEERVEVGCGVPACAALVVRRNWCSHFARSGEARPHLVSAA